MSLKFVWRQLALAALATCATSGAWPAQPTAAQARSLEAQARSHIAAFPDATLHGPDHGYRLKDLVLDDDGSSHARFDRSYRGVRVIGGDLVVHQDRDGHYRSTSRTLNRVLALDTRPGLTEAMAVTVALAAHKEYARLGKPELVVYARGEGVPALAYDVTLTGEQTDGTPSNLHAIIDARNGRQLDAWDDIHTGAANGTGRSLYSGTVPLGTELNGVVYYLRDLNRGFQYTADLRNKKVTTTVFIFYDADNLWGNFTTTDPQTAGVDAHYGAAVTWDYYKNVHGRNGIANDGMGVPSRVHYGKNYSNAFWDGSSMTYGDGDGRNFRPLVSTDVAGHEMSHGVTERTANLIYSGESGGLDEATSDIFGTMVEFYANNTGDMGDYLFGEKITIKTPALRYMDQPSRDGSSPDCWYQGVGNLDVHLSSGIGNHFYYLLAEGSGAKTLNGVSYNSPTCNGLAVTGIGRAKAEKIWYRALTVYMTSSTSYAGARAATLSAAADLHGAGSAEYNAVASAWSAVSVN